MEAEPYILCQGNPVSHADWVSWEVLSVGTCPWLGEEKQTQVNCRLDNVWR